VWARLDAALAADGRAALDEVFERRGVVAVETKAACATELEKEPRRAAERVVLHRAPNRLGLRVRVAWCHEYVCARTFRGVRRRGSRDLERVHGQAAGELRVEGRGRASAELGLDGGGPGVEGHRRESVRVRHRGLVAAKGGPKREAEVYMFRRYWPPTAYRLRLI
jgi:hypothetical protein